MSDALSTALLTDRYELTMLEAALRDGTADRRCVFELFGRRLSGGRRFGVVAGTGRLLGAWRLQAGSDPRDAAWHDRVLRSVLRRPVLSAVVIAAAVAVAFTVLLVIGPPGGRA